LYRTPKKGATDEYEKRAEAFDLARDDPGHDKSSEEEEAGQNITPKAAAKTTAKTAKNSAQKAAEKAAKMERNKVLSEKGGAGLLTPEEQKELIESFKSKAPTTRTKYDHDTTMENLINDTGEVVALMEKLKDDHYAVHYMWLLCEYWKTLHKITDPENRAKKNANDAFFKFFKKYQHEHGLPPATPSTAGSKTSSRTVSRAASVAPDEEQEEMEEMEEMEEIEEDEEEVEETK